jgi:hypothetical protein
MYCTMYCTLSFPAALAPLPLPQVLSLQAAQHRQQQEVASLAEAKEQLTKRHEKALDSMITLETDNGKLNKQASRSTICGCGCVMMWAQARQHAPAVASMQGW